MSRGLLYFIQHITYNTHLSIFAIDHMNKLCMVGYHYYGTIETS